MTAARLRRVIIALGIVIATLPALRAGTAESASEQPSSHAFVKDDEQTRKFHNDVLDNLQDRKTKLGSDYAGAWVNPDDRKHVYVAFKGEVATDKAKNDPAKSALTKDSRVTFVSHEFSADELSAGVSRVAEILNKLLVDGTEADNGWPFIAGVSNKNNRVYLQVSKAASDRKQEIEEALKDDIQAGLINIEYNAETHQTPKLNGCTTRATCQPVRGGLEIGHLQENGQFVDTCTSGFVFRNTTGTKFLSTAGHCVGAPGTTGPVYHPVDVTNPNNLVGPTVWARDHTQGSNPDHRVDAAIIDLTNPARALPIDTIYRCCPTVQGPAPSDVKITNKVNYPRDTLEDQQLCKEGRTTGETCGDLTNWMMTWNGSPGFGRYSAYNCGGDSGGPVIGNESYPNYAFGLHAGGVGPNPDCNNEGAFSWTRWIEEATGFTYSVLTTRATDRMKQNQSLRGQYTDQLLESPNGAYQAIMSSGGNFFLKNVSTGATVWKSNTTSTGSARVVMQADGNLVMYGVTPSCASGTGTDGSFVKVQDDGKLIVYSPSGTPLWIKQAGSPNGC